MQLLFPCPKILQCDIFVLLATKEYNYYEVADFVDKYAACIQVKNQICDIGILLARNQEQSMPEQG